MLIMHNFFILYLFKGAITKRMTAIEEMAGMDVLCSDKTGTLTLNRLTVDRNLVEVHNITSYAIGEIAGSNISELGSEKLQ